MVNLWRSQFFFQVLSASMPKTVIKTWFCWQNSVLLDFFNSSSSLRSFNSSSLSWKPFSHFSCRSAIASLLALLRLVSLRELQFEALSWASLRGVSESLSKDLLFHALCILVFLVYLSCLLWWLIIVVDFTLIFFSFINLLKKIIKFCVLWTYPEGTLLFISFSTIQLQ